MADIQIFLFLSFILFSVLIFYLLRSTILWYFKIDKRIKLMEENNKLIQEFLDRKGD